MLKNISSMEKIEKDMGAQEYWRGWITMLLEFLSAIFLFYLFFSFFFLFESRFHCVAQIGLELKILLPQPPWWYCRYIPPCLANFNFYLELFVLD
jgi:hypothetical protein